jgi:pyruvate kinase
VESGEVFARVVSPGPLAPRKGINVTFARPELPAITEKDVADPRGRRGGGADFVALSFVRSAADMEELRARLTELGSDARIVAKIEKVEAVAHLDEIIAATDGVMVARGGLRRRGGRRRGAAHAEGHHLSRHAGGKLVITATQMLESMIQAPGARRAPRSPTWPTPSSTAARR